jgi:molybdate transport system substrate-binding protein
MLRRVFLLVCLCLCGVSACKPRPPDALLIFAASSLSESMTAIGHAFEREHPGLEVALQFAGSQQLLAQVEQGARPDVFAAADLSYVARLSKLGLLKESRVFAHNHLVLVVPKHQTLPIFSLQDLPLAPRIVVGAKEVPVGQYTGQLLAAADRQWGHDFQKRVESQIVSYELSVRQVLGKVLLGEADAGFVYWSDVHGHEGELRVIEPGPALNVVAQYPLLLLQTSTQPKLAAAFMEFVLSPTGQRHLAAGGLVPPAQPASVRRP